MLGRGKKSKENKSGADLRTKAANRSAFNYYSSSTSSPKLDTRKPVATIELGSAKRRLRLLPTVLALAVIVFSLLINMTLTSKPSVYTLNDQVSPYHTTDEYADAASEIMSNNPGNLTKLTINTSDIEQALLERFPELKAVVVRLPILGRKPSLVIDIRPPAIMLVTQNSSYVLDTNGTVIQNIQSLSSEDRAGLLVLRDQSGLEIKPGDQAVTSDTVRFVTDVVAQLNAQKVEIQELVLPASANELDVRVKGEPYFIKMDVSGDPRLQAGSFLAVRDELKGRGVTPSEYIDVRVEEKAFYK